MVHLPAWLTPAVLGGSLLCWLIFAWERPRFAWPRSGPDADAPPSRPARLGRLRPQPLPTGLLLALCGGLLHGTASAGARTRSCQLAIPDGATLELHGYFEGVPGEGAAPFIARAGLPGGCRARVRAVVREDVSVPPAAASLVIRGQWLARPLRRGMPPEYAGTLVVRSLEVDEGARAVPLAVRLRAVVRERLDVLYPARAGLGEALILARRERLAREVRDQWARAGIAHLLAISGFHVGVIAAILYLLARRIGLGPGRAPLAAAAGSWAYVLAIGSPVAATRAAFILAALAAGRLLGRRVSSLGALATAFIALLAARPDAIVSVAFQLSFAGAAGLVLLAPPVSRVLRAGRLARLPPALRTGLASGIAATAATFPLVAWHFGYFATAGIPVTLVAGPLVAAAIPGMLLSILLSFISLPLAGIFAGGVDLFLQLAGAIVSVVVDLPGAAVWTPRWWIVAATAALAVYALVVRGLALRLRPPVRAAVLVASLAAAMVAWPIPALIGGGGAMELVFLDVGQGDAVAIRTPGSRWILVDTGPRSRTFDSGERIVAPYLRRRGAARLEALILTHPDLDHIGGANAVLSELDVRRVLDPGVPAARPAYVAALERAQARGATWFAARAGDRVSADGVTLEVLHPGGAAASAASDEANDQSVVLLLRYGDFTALLPGDAPAAVEDALLAAGRIPPLDLLKAGHHGSRTSTSWRLLEFTQPELGVVSAGARNRYGHPHAEILDRLERAGVDLARTDLQGVVRVRAFPTGDFTLSVERCPVLPAC
ncbi:MAG: DNA internalization-related competence protein ComEC/Rec2 [Gammaproteobacteria bacterium]|nr:DNA internalization-related competence protein ComEC/Rec2 [Gammaproteobacteria bacterium]MYC98002.1 DNA internalization-related competence protein ComEC/Rec2 [Gammaproteobacteria bacterium]